MAFAFGLSAIGAGVAGSLARQTPGPALKDMFEVVALEGGMSAAFDLGAMAA